MDLVDLGALIVCLGDPVVTGREGIVGHPVYDNPMTIERHVFDPEVQTNLI